MAASNKVHYGDEAERIYDVAVSDGRTFGADGRAQEPVGITVDLPSATYTNTIGDAILTAHRVDLDFDASEQACYYVRVLEIPTPSWTTCDAAFFGIDLPDTVPPGPIRRRSGNAVGGDRR